MHEVEISYSLGTSRNAEALVRNPLMDLLRAVQQHGSISSAARALNLSYRHVWGELKRWEKTLARNLIIWDKGQPARLSPFGDKLLRAERQAQARLAPQIAALHAGLGQAFATAFDDGAQVLRLHASHDDALAALCEHAAGHARLHLEIQFCGSVDAVQALHQGRCTMAGFHALEQPAIGTLAQRTYQPLLHPDVHRIIGVAQRSQGLLVARGNPLKLDSLRGLKLRKARYVNRGPGTGTRLLLDELMARCALGRADIDGYDRTEPSQAAVAQAVAAGSADAGLGLEFTAHANGLDFVPLARERYHLVCLKSALTQPAVLALLNLLRSAQWQSRLAALPGHAAAESGQVLPLRKLLPWWEFKRTKHS